MEVGGQWQMALGGWRWIIAERVEGEPRAEGVRRANGGNADSLDKQLNAGKGAGSSVSDKGKSVQVRAI
jgi:hypothetical protein